MATFNTNQARQLYVAKEVKDDAASVLGTSRGSGAIAVIAPENGDTPYISYMGKGGALRTDLIENVAYATLTKATDASQKRFLKQVTIKLDEDINVDAEGNVAPIAGQDYLVRILIRQAFGMSDEDKYFKHGCVHATKGMTAETFYQKLADSIKLNLKRDSEINKWFEVTSSAAGVVITEVKQDWVRGTKALVPVYFEVYPTTITVDGDEVIWGVATKADSTEFVNNAEAIADLEYFCAGEKGDIYRNVGWPNVISTKYMIDPDNLPAAGFDIIDIHFAYQGTCEDIQKSEKDLTIVGETSVIASVKTALTAAGITVNEKTA